MNEKRMPWIDALKGISIVLVVFYHVIIFNYNIPFKLELYNRTIFDSANYFFAYRFIPLRMPLFFLISGFLASNAIFNKNWGQVFHSKIGICLYMFVLWCILQNFFFHIVGNDAPTGVNPLTMHASLLVDFFEAMIVGRSPLWYLYALAIFFSCSKFLKKYPLWLFTGAFILNVFVFFEAPPFPFKNMSYCFLFFITGVFFGKTIFIFLQNSTLKHNLIGLSVCVASLAATNLIFDFRFRLLESVFGIYVMSVFVINWYKLGGALKIFEFIGRNTLPIYVIHPLIIELITLVVVPSLTGFAFINDNNHILFSAFAPFLLTALCLLCSLFIWRVTDFSYGKYFYGYRIGKSTS